MQYKAKMIILCKFDGAVLNLTNSVITETTTPSPGTSSRLLTGTLLLNQRHIIESTDLKLLDSVPLCFFFKNNNEHFIAHMR